MKIQTTLAMECSMALVLTRTGLHWMGRRQWGVQVLFPVDQIRTDHLCGGCARFRKYKKEKNGKNFKKEHNFHFLPFSLINPLQ